MAMVTYVFTISQINSQRQELRTNIGRVAKQIASIRLAETQGWYVYQDWIDNILNSDFSKDLVYIAVFNEKVSLVAFSLNAKWLDLAGGTFLYRAEQADIVMRLSQGQVAEESQADFDHQVVAIRWGAESLGKVDVGFSLIEFNNAIRRRLLINLELLALFSLLGVASSVFISRRITKPLNDLAQAMLAASAGDLNQHVKSRSRDEIGYLSQSFDDMISGLREKASIEQFTHELGFTFKLERIAQLTTEYIVKAVQARNGSLFWIHERGPKVTARLAHSYPSQEQKDDEFELSPEQHNALWNNKESFCFCGDGPSMDSPSDGSFTFHREGGPGDRLVIPISQKEKLLAYLILDGKADGSAFDEDEKKFLKTLSSQAAFAIENALLLNELTDKERLKRELEIARLVQKRFLPAEEPRLSGLDLSGICIPATEVGGDYYDFFVFSPDKIGIVVADVSGKGTSAAFYMAEIKGMMTSLAYILDSPKEVITRVNERLYESLDRRIFATMLYGVLDLASKRLTFVRAGHNALLVKRAGAEKQIEISVPLGMGLGLTNTGVFTQNIEERTIDLQLGDALLFYTDGISEAMRKGYEEFGEGRMIDILLSSDNKSARGIQSGILDEVARFVADASQHDDMTMVVAKLE